MIVNNALLRDCVLFFKYNVIMIFIACKEVFFSTNTFSIKK